MAKPPKKKTAKRERRERRFVPRAGANATMVRALYMIGAAVLGAGAWALFGKQALTGATEAVPYATWIAAAGFVLVGVAVWLGTSGDAIVRVGDPGVALEKGELKRIPWWALKSIKWDAAADAVVVNGKTAEGASLSFKLRRKVHAEAIAWLLKESRARLDRDPVRLPEDVEDSIPKASTQAGQIVRLEPIQVVGRHCADSEELIAYEPDALVCARCERIYSKKHAPKKCACGASMGSAKKGASDSVEAAESAEQTAETPADQDDGETKDESTAEA